MKHAAYVAIIVMATLVCITFAGGCYLCIQLPGTVERAEEDIAEAEAIIAEADAIAEAIAAADRRNR